MKTHKLIQESIQFFVSLPPSFVQVQSQKSLFSCSETESGSFPCKSALLPNQHSCTLSFRGNRQLTWSIIWAPSSLSFQSGLITTFSHRLLQWLRITLTYKLLKHSAWNGLISHFTGLHAKKIDSVFSVLHVHPNTSRHLPNQSSLYPSTSDGRQSSSVSACSWPHAQAHIHCAS